MSKANLLSKVATLPKATENKPGLSPDERLERIAMAAYYKAERRNFEPGYEQQDWFEAEQEVDAAFNDYPSESPGIAESIQAEAA